MSGARQLRRYDKDLDYSYTFGVFPTLELLTHRPERARRVVAHSRGERGEGLTRVAERCAALGVPFETNDRAVERLAHKGNVYVFGVFEKYTAPLSKTENHVLLVNPSDNGNLGTVARTMLAFGFRDVALLEPAAHLFNPHVVRASMGATFALRFGYFGSLDGYRAAFPHTLYPFMLNAPRTLGEVTFRPPYALTFGPEGAGLPPEYAEVGERVVIPQSPLVESLNLGVAVGIALYEARAGASRAARSVGASARFRPHKR